MDKRKSSRRTEKFKHMNLHDNIRKASDVPPLYVPPICDRFEVDEDEDVCLPAYPMRGDQSIATDLAQCRSLSASTQHLWRQPYLLPAADASPQTVTASASGAVSPLPHDTTPLHDMTPPNYTRPATPGTAVATVRSAQEHHSNLLLLALIDHLGGLYLKNEKQQRALFKVILDLLPDKNLPTCLDEYGYIRNKFKTHFLKVFNAAVNSVKKQVTLDTVDHPFVPGQVILSVKSDIYREAILANKSRYTEEYSQISQLGRGAYGVVYKALHKIDGCEYAVKKIRLSNNKPELWFKTLREVRYLASVSHKNIVRYNSAWLEYVTAELPHGDMQTNLTAAFENADRALMRTPSTPSDKDDCSIVFEASHEEDGISHNSEVLQDQDDLSYVSEMSHSSPDQIVTPASMYNRAGSFVVFDHYIQSTQAMLYIQMELCTYTLKKWIRERNMAAATSDDYSVINGDDNVVLLKQLLKALEHVHNRGLIHRDVKPKNIFFSSSPTSDTPSLHIKLGDFGLTRQIVDEPMTPSPGHSGHPDTLSHDDEPQCPPCSPKFTSTPLQRDSRHQHRDANAWPTYNADDCEPCDRGSDDGNDSHDSSSCKDEADIDGSYEYTAAVGTTLYASPEQLMSSNYDSKSDMYSVGLIIYELYQPFGTEMEKITCIRHVREGNLPDAFVAQWPEVSDIIKSLLQAQSSARPSATQLLHCQLFLRKDQVLSKLREQVISQENVILQQQQLLKEKDLYIASLEQKLKEYEEGDTIQKT